MVKRMKIMKRSVKIFAFVFCLTLLFPMTAAMADSSAQDTEQVLPALSEEELLTFVCLSDVHIDYGLNEWETPMRQSVIRTTEAIEKEGADLILFGGDLTSTNDASHKWTPEVYEKPVELFRSLTSAATKTGWVLYADGNHESQTGYGRFDSGDFSKIMQEDIGPFAHSLYEDNGHLLCYHYVLKGFDFIGINTPWRVSTSPYEYLPEQTDWLRETMTEIGKGKTVFLFMHYPLPDANGISRPAYGMTEESAAAMKAVLCDFPDAVLFYGHDHGGDAQFIDACTEQRVTAYSQAGEPGLTIRPEGYVSCFMGSMGYYNNRFNNYQGLGADEPAVVQALTVHVFSDHITFEMKNYGEQSGSSYELQPFCVLRSSLQLTSDVCGCDAAAGVLSLPAGFRDLGEVRAALHTGYELTFTDENGVEVDDDHIVEAGMKAVLRSGDTVLQTLTLTPAASNTGIMFVVLIGVAGVAAVYCILLVKRKKHHT